MSAPTPAPDSSDRIAALEARVARLEAYTGILEELAVKSSSASSTVHPGRTADQLEVEVGQNWFARFGIGALAIGGGYILILPYPDLPPIVPPVAGLVVASGLFLIAHLAKGTFALATSYLRGVAMALLFCASVRFSYFGVSAVLPAAGSAAHGTILGAVLVNLVIGWRRRSPLLVALALVTATAGLVALGDATTVLCGIVTLAVAIAFFGTRDRWGWLLPFGAILVSVAYAIWAMGDPIVGHPYHWVLEPAAASLILLFAIAVIAYAPLWVRISPDEPPGALAALVSCVFGYGAFLAHTYAIGTPVFAGLHVCAAIMFLWLAAVLWRRYESQIATFFYAMCAYTALMVAILKLAVLPVMLMWLSMESVLVVATAIWFRSRFIILANFVIYGVAVLGYMILNERESGVSLGFGVVALLSARILNWQQHRLALKTDFMRNAYLVSAFIVFPYALYHLVSPRHAAFAWVGLALLYYALNVVIRNQKYRWMGHATLLLTTVYLIIPNHPGMTTAIRFASFLAVGTALLAVSIVFTQMRRPAGEHPPAG